MTALGPHADFIVASYAAAFVIVLAMIAWVWRDYRRQTRILAVPPYSEAEMPEGLKNQFTGKGIRVGVVAGGYGSDAVLRFLEKTPGVDALAIGCGDILPGHCQVVVVPQLRTGTVPADLEQKLETFVRAGGGLITTHDAVGYRDMPHVLTEVCKGGTEKVRDEAWKAARAHPVTSGLAPGRALTRGYFDHIELECGPNGTPLAVSEKSGKPVVAAGECGKGRYVACGLCIGLGPDNEDAPPTADEAALLRNAIRWCARL